MIPREKITAALGAMPPLHATNTQPSVVTTWSAWPVWSSTSWINRCVRQTRWFVFVVLPSADQSSTIEAGDPLIEDVGDAMTAIQLTVDLVEPVRLVLEPGQAGVPALRFTLID